MLLKMICDEGYKDCVHYMDESGSTMVPYGIEGSDERVEIGRCVVIGSAPYLVYGLAGHGPPAEWAVAFSLCSANCLLPVP